MIKVLRKINVTWLAALFPIVTNGAVNDIFPADFVPLPPETHVATTYLFDKTSSGPFAGGVKTADWKIKSQSAVFRLAKFKDWNGTVVAGSFVGGLTQQTLSGEGVPDAINRSASGVRDLRFNGTAWLINRPEQREYLAANATWLLPTGQYDSGDAQNIGDNRHQLALTLAWLQGIGERWNFELITELAGHSPNHSYFPGATKQTKDLSHAITSYLRYNWGSGLETYYGYEWNGGGNTKLNGIPQHDPNRFDRSMLGLIYQPNQTNVLNLRLSKDIHIESGFRADQEIALRWLYFY